MHHKYIGLLLVLVGLLVLTQLTGWGQDETDVQELFNQAQNCLQEKKYTEAIALFEKAVKLDEKQPAAYYNIACCYSLTKQTDKALVWFEKSLSYGFLNYSHITKDTDLNNIRNDRRFKQLLKKYNLEIGEKNDILFIKSFNSNTLINDQELMLYSYVLACAKTREAALIDPAGSWQEIQTYLKDNNLTLKHIIITHGQNEYVTFLKDLLKTVSIPVYTHEASADALQKLINYDDIMPLKDGNIITVGNLIIKVLATPGFTPDSTCFYIEKDKRLFSGLALMIPSEITKETREYFKKYFSGFTDDIKVYSTFSGYELFSNLRKTIGREH
jgi:hydroxyacylglutathione hydrolase